MKTLKPSPTPNHPVPALVYILSPQELRLAEHKSPVEAKESLTIPAKLKARLQSRED